MNKQQTTEGACPPTDCSRNNFEYLIERLSSCAFRDGLSPGDPERKAKHAEAINELWKLGKYFPANSKLIRPL